jgi:hypothetical protein
LDADCIVALNGFNLSIYHRGQTARFAKQSATQGGAMANNFRLGQGIHVRTSSGLRLSWHGLFTFLQQ